jgi:hypothetical protein
MKLKDGQIGTLVFTGKGTYADTQHRNSQAITGRLPPRKFCRLPAAAKRQLAK